MKRATSIISLSALILLFAASGCNGKDGPGEDTDEDGDADLTDFSETDGPCDPGEEDVAPDPLDDESDEEPSMDVEPEDISEDDFVAEDSTGEDVDEDEVLGEDAQETIEEDLSGEDIIEEDPAEEDAELEDMGFDPCVPACSGRVCGPDGCGGTCATDVPECPGGEYCDWRDGQCKPTCDGVANCAAMGRECGDDGCGGSCGECSEGEACIDGQCVLSAGCTPRPGPGCMGCACESCVCSHRSQCCTTAWDAECVYICQSALYCNFPCGG